MNRKESLTRGIAAAVIACGLMPAAAWSDTPTSRPPRPAERPRAGDQRLQPEVSFDRTRGQVTVRVSPRHLREIKVPFQFRERLTVFENGVRQTGVSVDVEHSPMTVAVLIENGGRSHQLNESISSDAVMLIRPLLDALDGQDRLGVFAYDDSVRTIVDFETPRDQWNIALGRVPTAKFSEANFYDATAAVLDRLAGMSGRKALLVLSTGIDTFSRTTFAEVVARAEKANLPVYVFNLGAIARPRLSPAFPGLLGRVDWAGCQRQLERLAEVSGGRAYQNPGSTDVRGIYDEVIEDVKVRYVLTYTPSLTTPSLRRTVQVAVLDSVSGDATSVAATSRRRSDARVIAEATYAPVEVAAAASAAADARRMN